MDQATKRKMKMLRHAASSDGAAVDYLEKRRWPGEACCPRWGDVDCYQMKTRAGERNPDFRWRCRGCRRTFTVRTGTPMEESRLPLRYWVHVLWRACASKKGVSAKQIERELCVEYRTALFLPHRVRTAMLDRDPALLGGEGTTVEADETYVGGRPRRRNTRPRGRGTLRQPVFAAVERHGRVRMRVTPRRMTAQTLGDEVARAVDPMSRLVTDQLHLYRPVGATMLGGHFAVNHGVGEYVSASNPELHGNTAESVFAVLKRGLYGVYHSVTVKHLPKYLGEFEYRWNTRSVDDFTRLDRLVREMRGKRLTYTEQVAGGPSSTGAPSPVADVSVTPP